MTKKSIALCDDNADLLRVLSDFLSKDPELEILTFTSSVELLRHLIEHPIPPDLLVIDYLLPDTEGENIITSLRKHFVFKVMSIILMSGVVKNVEQIAKEAGANDYLIKPFSMGTFKQKVYKLL